MTEKDSLGLSFLGAKDICISSWLGLEDISIRLHKVSSRLTEVSGGVDYLGRFNGLIWSGEDGKKVFEFWFDEKSLWIRGRLAGSRLVVFCGLGERKLFVLYENKKEGWSYIDISGSLLEDWTYILWGKVCMAGEIVGGGFFKRKDDVWVGELGCNWRGGWISSWALRYIFRSRNIEKMPNDIVGIERAQIKIGVGAGKKWYVELRYKASCNMSNHIVWFAFQDIGDILAIRREYKNLKKAL